jgi:hypothetical protein
MSLLEAQDWPAQRLERWCQVRPQRLRDAAAAAAFVRRVGLATLFPVSPEIPNLYHAHTGDAAARPETTWDSPAGEVYSWRWALGRPEAASYTTFVMRRPTWISWDLFPAALRLRDALQSPEALHATGALSAGAYRIARVLADCDGVLGTGVLRAMAGFPTGKSERAAYLRAIAELDDRLLLAKVFAADDDEMRHALVHVRYPQHVAAAEALSAPEALDRLLLAYLPHAVYARPTALAKALTLPVADLRASLARLAGAGQVVPVSRPDESEPLYNWAAGAAPSDASPTKTWVVTPATLATID